MNLALFIGLAISLLIGALIAFLKERLKTKKQDDFMIFHKNLQLRIESSINTTIEPLIRKIDDLAESKEAAPILLPHVSKFHEDDYSIELLKNLKAGIYSTSIYEVLLNFERGPSYKPSHHKIIRRGKTKLSNAVFQH